VPLETKTHGTVSAAPCRQLHVGTSHVHTQCLSAPRLHLIASPTPSFRIMKLALFRALDSTVTHVQLRTNNRYARSKRAAFVYVWCCVDTGESGCSGPRGASLLHLLPALRLHNIESRWARIAGPAPMWTYLWGRVHIHLDPS
jgi:hypothetical protein